MMIHRLFSNGCSHTTRERRLVGFADATEDPKDIPLSAEKPVIESSRDKLVEKMLGEPGNKDALNKELIDQLSRDAKFEEMPKAVAMVKSRVEKISAVDSMNVKELREVLNSIPNDPDAFIEFAIKNGIFTNKELSIARFNAGEKRGVAAAEDPARSGRGFQRVGLASTPSAPASVPSSAPSAPPASVPVAPVVPAPILVPVPEVMDVRTMGKDELAIALAGVKENMEVIQSRRADFARMRNSPRGGGQARQNRNALIAQGDIDMREYYNPEYSRLGREYRMLNDAYMKVSGGVSYGDRMRADLQIKKEESIARMYASMPPEARARAEEIRENSRRPLGAVRLIPTGRIPVIPVVPVPSYPDGLIRLNPENDRFAQVDQEILRKADRLGSTPAEVRQALNGNARLDRTVGATEADSLSPRKEITGYNNTPPVVIELWRADKPTRSITLRLDARTGQFAMSDRNDETIRLLAEQGLVVTTEPDMGSYNVYIQGSRNGSWKFRAGNSIDQWSGIQTLAVSIPKLVPSPAAPFVAVVPPAPRTPTEAPQVAPLPPAPVPTPPIEVPSTPVEKPVDTSKTVPPLSSDPVPVPPTEKKPSLSTPDVPEPSLENLRSSVKDLENNLTTLRTNVEKAPSSGNARLNALDAYLAAFELMLSFKKQIKKLTTDKKEKAALDEEIQKYSELKEMLILAMGDKKNANDSDDMMKGLNKLQERINGFIKKLVPPRVPVRTPPTESPQNTPETSADAPADAFEAVIKSKIEIPSDLPSGVTAKLENDNSVILNYGGMDDLKIPPIEFARDGADSAAIIRKNAEFIVNAKKNYETVKLKMEKSLQLDPSCVFGGLHLHMDSSGQTDYRASAILSDERRSDKIGGRIDFIQSDSKKFTLEYRGTPGLHLLSNNPDTLAYNVQLCWKNIAQFNDVDKYWYELARGETKLNTPSTRQFHGLENTLKNRDNIFVDPLLMQYMDMLTERVKTYKKNIKEFEEEKAANDTPSAINPSNKMTPEKDSWGKEDVEKWLKENIVDQFPIDKNQDGFPKLFYPSREGAGQTPMSFITDKHNVVIQFGTIKPIVTKKSYATFKAEQTGGVVHQIKVDGIEFNTFDISNKTVQEMTGKEIVTKIKEMIKQNSGQLDDLPADATAPARQYPPAPALPPLKKQPIAPRVDPPAPEMPEKGEAPKKSVTAFPEKIETKEQMEEAIVSLKLRAETQGRKDILALFSNGNGRFLEKGPRREAIIIFRKDQTDTLKLVSPGITVESLTTTFVFVADTTRLMSSLDRALTPKVVDKTPPTSRPTFRGFRPRGFSAPDDVQNKTPSSVPEKSTEPVSEKAKPAKLDVIVVDPLTPEDIRVEIAKENVLHTLETKGRHVAESGRMYRKVDGVVYYNSKPREKNTWANIANDKPTYAEVKTKPIELKIVNAPNSIPRVWESVDSRFVFDQEGNLIEPINGIYQYPESDIYYKRVDGKLLDCDAEGTLRESFITSLKEFFKPRGFNVSYEDGWAGALGGRRITMVLPDGGEAKLFDISIGIEKGKFAVTCKDERSVEYTSFEEVLSAANKRKEKILKLDSENELGNKAEKNTDKFRHYLNAHTILTEIRTSFDRSGHFSVQLANQAAWMIVENFQNGNPDGLTLKDGEPLIQEIAESLNESRMPDPNGVDTVARFYKLQFEKEGNSGAKQKAIELLRSTIKKSHDGWDDLTKEQQKMVEKNEVLLKELE